MFADKDFMMYVSKKFDPTASATAYGQRPKFVSAKHSARAEGENSAYGPTLHNPPSKLQEVQRWNIEMWSIILLL